MKVGDYVRIKNNGIKKILDIGEYLGMKQYLIDEDGTYTIDSSIIKSSPNIIDLLQPMDLLYIDIDNSYAGGIIVPRIAETQAELNLMIDLIKSGKWILKGIVTKEQIENCMYKVGD